eukprot:6367612-Prymnesium_polylepis.1
MHRVEPLVSGCRIAVPAFFVTKHPEPPAAPASDADVAEALWRTLLMPQSEDDFKQFMAPGSWHRLLCAGGE